MTAAVTFADNYPPSKVNGISEARYDEPRTRQRVQVQVTHGAIVHWENGERTIPGSVLRLIQIYETGIPASCRKKKKRSDSPLGEAHLTSKEAAFSSVICSDKLRQKSDKGH